MSQDLNAPLDPLSPVVRDLLKRGAGSEYRSLVVIQGRVARAAARHFGPGDDTTSPPKPVNESSLVPADILISLVRPLVRHDRTRSDSGCACGDSASQALYRTPAADLGLGGG